MTDLIKPFNGFDYTSLSNPTADVNPTMTGMTWVNASTGELFICTDITVDENVWVGQLGSIIRNELWLYDSGNEFIPTTGGLTYTPSTTGGELVKEATRLVFSSPEWSGGNLKTVNIVNFGVFNTLNIEWSSDPLGSYAYVTVDSEISSDGAIISAGVVDKPSISEIPLLSVNKELDIYIANLGHTDLVHLFITKIWLGNKIWLSDN